MPDLQSILPVIRDFDYSSPPIGYVEKLKDGRTVIRLNETAAVKTEDITSRKYVFAPSYAITKDDEGVVQEVEIVAFALTLLHP